MEPVALEQSVRLAVGQEVELEVEVGLVEKEKEGEDVPEGVLAVEPEAGLLGDME